MCPSTKRRDPGAHLFTEDSLPGDLRVLAAGARLGVAWGPLVPAVMCISPPVLSSIDAVSVLGSSESHTPASGLVPPVASRACCVEAGVVSWRPFQAELPEMEADGLVASGTSPAVSCCGS